MTAHAATLDQDMALHGVTITGTLEDRYQEILTPEALAFLAALHHRFGRQRRDILAARVVRQHRLDEGETPEFLEETRNIRESAWTVATIPPDLIDRRVEITGPVERKMIINALNSGASVFMADFEDSNSPTWSNVLDGQVNLHDAVRRTITYSSPQGKHYKLESLIATLVVRPRGWHLVEKHVLVDGEPISASLFDFGLFLFHNATEQMARESGPYFYLPKLENHLEARLWNDVFVYAQEYIGIPAGSIRATVLIENILAAFEMDEILWELKDHSAGLNCGRWDYIFSFIKKFRARPEFVLPDRGQVTMDRHFLKSYVELLIHTCHRRGIHAMGGMAAQIPVKNDPEVNDAAMEKVRQDKLREVKAGHDGTWVAHPGLISIAMEIFDEYMEGPNQIHQLREDLEITPDDLIAVPVGPVTENGLRHNIDVGLQYLEAWLRGNGCVPIYNLMEDAATAEISRSQIWQWVRHGTVMDDGQPITAHLVSRIIGEELAKLRDRLGPETFEQGEFALASALFGTMIDRRDFQEWLTVVAYPHLD